MEEQLNPLAITHLLQHTLRGLCIHESSQLVYAVFWRILPRNYPPPKILSHSLVGGWDLQGGAYDRTRGNRRNWILVWEDGFCNFSPSASCDNSEAYQMKGLQPELFFKMSHEIYNYGEGLIGKVASDHSHKWVYKEPQDDQEINFLSAWNNPADSHPRTWEAQFQSGIKTIALIAVREGGVQLGHMKKVAEDRSYVVLLRKRFSYLESIPDILLPHPSSAAFPVVPENWPVAHDAIMPPPIEYFDHFSQQMRITPSMSSLEALLSKLPSVGAGTPGASAGYYAMPMMAEEQRGGVVAKEEMEEYGGESSSSMASYYVNVRNPGGGDRGF